MLPKVNRLKDRSDFASILAEGSYLKGRVVGLKFLRPSGEYEPPKLGLVVSKKFSKRATDRNLVKRRLRAIMRGVLPRMVGGVKLIIIVSRPEVDVSFESLRHDLLELLEEAGIIYGD